MRSTRPSRLHDTLRPLLAEAYETMTSAGEPAAIAQTLRVGTISCPHCTEIIRLFPTALVSLTTRVDCGGGEGWVACPAGHLTLSRATKPTTNGSVRTRPTVA